MSAATRLWRYGNLEDWMMSDLDDMDLETAKNFMELERKNKQLQIEVSQQDQMLLNQANTIKALQAEVERVKSEQPEWIPCCESAPGIEHSDIQCKVWFFDGSNVRRIPYYCLKGCADYSGTLEYKHGFWMAIPRASKPKPPVKAKEPT